MHSTFARAYVLELMHGSAWRLSCPEWCPLRPLLPHFIHLQNIFQEWRRIIVFPAREKCCKRLKDTRNSYLVSVCRYPASGSLTQSSSNISVPLWNKVVKGLDLLLFLIVLMKIHQPRLLVGPCHKEQNNINFHIYHYLAITRGKSISYLLQVC